MFNCLRGDILLLLAVLAVPGSCLLIRTWNCHFFILAIFVGLGPCFLHLMRLFLVGIWKYLYTLMCFFLHCPAQEAPHRAAPAKPECLTQESQMSHGAWSSPASVGDGAACFCSHSRLPVTQAPLCPHSLVGCGFLLIFVE